MKKLMILLVGLCLSGCSTVFSGPQCTTSQVWRVVNAKQVAVVYFADGKSDLSKTDLEKIKKVAEQAIAENAKVVVYGHASHRTRPADPIQKMLINIEVSNDRAINVSKALVDYGVAAEDIHPAAMFDSRPVRKEVTRADEAANRRAELVLYWLNNE